MLIVKELSVQFSIKGHGVLHAVDNVSLDIGPGEIIGLVGESGCGKTVFSLSPLRLIRQPGRITAGQILWEGNDVLQMKSEEMRKLRGEGIAMIFQNPQSSLNPVYTIGHQLREIIKLHRALSKHETAQEAIRLLNTVGIPDPERLITQYPHQLSVGMCQRVMIAMALSCRPKLLIADEPTASLDVTIQAQIMDLLKELKDQFGMAILLVSHDLGVIANMCDRIAVMYLGRIMEIAPKSQLYRNPLHPYTQALLQSIPLPNPDAPRQGYRLKGDVPSPVNIPSGCRFRTRCPKVFEPCDKIDPALLPVTGQDHPAACLLYNNPK
jgi:peptide/nickel transport system ATP-binding protein